MHRAKRRKNELLWLAGLLCLVSLHFWFPRLRRGPRDDTYSATAEGKKAFFLLTSRWGYAPEHNHRRIGRLLERFDPAGALCLLGPARYPTEAEWDRLLEWVSRGGSLLVAAGASDEGPESPLKIPGLGVRVERRSAPLETEDVETALAGDARFLWRTGGELIVPGEGRSRTLVTCDGTVQAVARPYGRGRVVVLASDFVFSNQSLAWADHGNAELALRLLEEAGAVDRIVFDESLNSSGTPKAVGLLFEPFLRPVTVQLLIGLLVFAWWRIRRFGPLLPPSVSARHNIVDHTDALGVLHYKTGNGAALVRSYFSQLEGELGVGASAGRERGVLESAAGRLGKPAAVVQRFFGRARQAAGRRELDRKSAARIIRRLALIRRAARGRARGR